MARRKRKYIQIHEGPCPFCEMEKNPDYKEVEGLKEYITDRGKIKGGIRTGVCSKHQRRLTKAIKRARHLGLLPFQTGI